MSEPEFQVGDHVQAFGVSGTVTDVRPAHFADPYPVRVSFSVQHGDEARYYKLDGRAEDWHAAPTLKLIGKMKEKVMMHVWLLNDPSSMDHGMLKARPAGITPDARWQRYPSLDAEVEV